MSTLGVGVIGLGFMGATHVSAVQAAARSGLPCRLAAVCDGDRARLETGAPRTGNLPGDDGAPLFDPRDVRTFTDPEGLIADPSVDVVHVCTWTDTHVDLALRALRAGKHVLVEKPVSLRSAEVARLAEEARRAARICMPAMCMRWWPGWDWLKLRVDEARAGRGAFGRVVSATFRRLGAAPAWAAFYADERRSGGALFDLHIHDVDFLIWCFGVPSAVAATGCMRHISTGYRFPGGPEHVVAEGAWSLTTTAGFRMHFQVCFEQAVAEFDITRPAPLMLHTEDASEPVVLHAGTGYLGEVAALIEAIAGGDVTALPSMEDAFAVTRVLEEERESLGDGWRTISLR